VFLSFLGVVCVMLATVGLMYLYIALRTHLDRSLLHFSVTLLLICGVAAIDVGIQPWRKGPEGSVFWLKQQHVLFCAIVPMLYSYLLRLTGEKWSRSLKLLALSTILLAPFFLYGDAMLYRDGDVNGATWLYRWVFLPLYVLYSGVALWLLIRGIRTSRSRERRVLATHLVGLTGLALFAGADVFLTSSAEIAAVPGFTIFGTLLFGVSTTVVFGDRLSPGLRQARAGVPRARGGQRA
jgi:hypothetical protein